MISLFSTKRCPQRPRTAQNIYHTIYDDRKTRQNGKTFEGWLLVETSIKTTITPTAKGKCPY